MKKLVFILLVVGTIISCEKNNHSPNEELEDIKNQLLGDWFYLSNGGRITLSFHKNDSLDFNIEVLIDYHEKFLYKIKSKDTLIFVNEDTVYVSGFQIDSSRLLKIDKTFYTEQYYEFERKTLCDKACYDTLKSKIKGKWKVINSFECNRCNDIYEFKENDSLYYHDYNTNDELIQINTSFYLMYPENYFGIKYDKKFSWFYNYLFHSDTVLNLVSYESFHSNFPTFNDTITLNKIPD